MQATHARSEFPTWKVQPQKPRRNWSSTQTFGKIFAAMVTGELPGFTHGARQSLDLIGVKRLHPWKLTWNLKITQLKRKIIFPTSIFGFHVSFRGCISWVPLPVKVSSWRLQDKCDGSCGHSGRGVTTQDIYIYTIACFTVGIGSQLRTIAVNIIGCRGFDTGEFHQT